MSSFDKVFFVWVNIRRFQKLGKRKFQEESAKNLQSTKLEMKGEEPPGSLV